MSKAGFAARRLLLDTNVISETRKRRPNARVMDFLRETPQMSQFVSVLALAELRIGALKLREHDPVGSGLLAEWIDELEAGYADRILPIDLEAAEVWAGFAAGRSRPPVDTLMAATAYSRGLTVVTRNVLDFKGLPVTLLNPWEA